MILHHTSGHRSWPNITPTAAHNQQLFSFYFFFYITAHNQQLQPCTMNSSLLDDFNNYIRLDLDRCNCPMEMWEPYSVLMLTYCVVLMFPTKKVTKKITGRNSWLLFSRVSHAADLVLPSPQLLLCLSLSKTEKGLPENQLKSQMQLPQQKP